MTYEPIDSLTDEHERDEREEAIERSINACYNDFLAACKRSDMKAPAMFAAQRSDFSRPPMYEGGARWKVDQTVSDVIGEAIDYLPDGIERAMALLCELAYSAEPNATLALRARALLEAGACKFAEFNCEG